MNNNSFFAGGNTTAGFFSYYNEILNTDELNAIYCIKGGPGVGKSTFMKKIGNYFKNKGYDITYYYCSSDPDSLDGVKIDNLKILFVDGTAPHIIDPKYPVAIDKIIDLAQFLSADELKNNRHNIIDITDKTSSYFKIAYKYLNAVKPLYENLNMMYNNALDKEKFNSSVRALAKEMINNKKGNGFKDKKLFISAITSKGITNFINDTLCPDTAYILKSEIGDLSYIFLNKLKNELEINQLECESYYCPVSPENKLEHLYIPELNIAVITSNKYHTCNKEGIEIDLSKLYFNTLISEEIKAYDSRLIEELFEKAVYYLKKAKLSHDILESYYINAMNFELLNEFTDDFISKII